jgi:hypothetical protein
VAVLNGSRRARLTGTLSLLLLAAVRASAQTPRSEYEVKAAYLLNFARYAVWPPAAPVGSSDDLVLCVLGHDPFGAVLDRTVAGRRVMGHGVRVLRPSSRAEAQLCRLAFIGGDRHAEIESWLSELRGRPVLTVGDGPGFAGAGGAIAFVPVDETVRFEVNLAALQRSGVRLSSRVLALANRVSAGDDR